MVKSRDIKIVKEFPSPLEDSIADLNEVENKDIIE
jgi:hypothetical protein